MNEQIETNQRDLRDYFHVLNRRKVQIGLTALVVGVLALAYAYRETPVYQASASVLVPEQLPSANFNIDNSSQLPQATSLQRVLADDQSFAQSDAVRAEAAKALGFKPSVSVGVSSTADILTFTAHSTQQDKTAGIANAYANAFITAQRANQVSQYTQDVSDLNGQIASLQRQIRALPAGSAQLVSDQDSITSLDQTLTALQASAVLAGQSGGTLATAATTPSSPTSPKTVRDGILGLLVGIFLGIALAFAVERLDDGINSRERAEQAAGGVPVVGLIPKVTSWADKRGRHVAFLEDPTSSAAEAYRTLRTTIQFLSIDHPKKVIGITSAGPEEGKSTAVANLAISFARASQRVIVVSCDLRRPRLHEFFGVSNQRGLTSLVIGEASISDVVLPIEPLLRLVPSGPIPPNPAEVLSLDRVREVIDLLAENCDVVLLDCPPVLPVSDTLLVSRLVDGMLLLASVESTSMRQLRRTYELLRQVNCNVMGTILNLVPSEGSMTYGYGYGYGYYPSYYGSEGAAGSEVPPDQSPSSNGAGARIEHVVPEGHPVSSGSGPVDSEAAGKATSKQFNLGGGFGPTDAQASRSEHATEAPGSTGTSVDIESSFSSDNAYPEVGTHVTSDYPSYRRQPDD